MTAPRVPRRILIRGLVAAIAMLWLGSALVVSARLGATESEFMAGSDREFPATSGSDGGALRSGESPPDPENRSRPGGGAADPAGAGADARGDDSYEPDWPPATIDDPDFPVSLSVNPECAHPGETVVATIRTDPTAYIAMQATYPDGTTNATMRYVGPVGPDGTRAIRWVVEDVTAHGEGRVFVAVGREREDGEGEFQRVSAPWHTAGPGGDCA